ncbi:hypothetical protein DF268_35885 [Streptomyces sp. V2]|uniref:hypothetical protein n=1 Tax=Streptomyces sp. V2 TaxID=1424099 RepID=UPI000D6697C7|nr:hypothetical protein [Streptomyces sp. V2]PWG08756.1 hypothetical protein DF268_35885 [Streptomyces sp. V2]
MSTEPTALGLAETLADVRRYLERGEPAAAVARIVSGTPLPPCGAVGPMPEHEPCGRWAGHGGAHSPGADLPDPPHACPALPDTLYAVVRLTPGRVRITGAYAAEGAADAAAEEFPAYTRERSAEMVAVARGGQATVALPPGAATVVVPVRLRPDPRQMDAWDLGAEDVRDYGDDVRDHE